MWNVISLLIVLFASVYFLVLGRSLRDWRARAQVVAGTAGVLWVGLSFGIRRIPLLAACASSLKGMAGGVAVGILITLYLVGPTDTQVSSAGGRRVASETGDLPEPENSDL
jgi:hypothetical protein